MNDEIAGRVMAAAVRLLDQVEKAVQELDAVTAVHKEKNKTDRGDEVIEYTVKLPRKHGAVDRGGLKQLAGVLKDLQDILYRDPALDVREQELRLKRLERELTLDPEAQNVTVALEGEVESFAG